MRRIRGNQHDRCSLGVVQTESNCVTISGTRHVDRGWGYRRCFRRRVQIPQRLSGYQNCGSRKLCLPICSMEGRVCQSHKLVSCQKAGSTIKSVWYVILEVTHGLASMFPFLFSIFLTLDTNYKLVSRSSSCETRHVQSLRRYRTLGDLSCLKATPMSRHGLKRLDTRVLKSPLSGLCRRCFMLNWAEDPVSSHEQPREFCCSPCVFVLNTKVTNSTGK